MGSKGTTFTSGDWMVTEGSEKDFVSAWTEFVAWSVDTHDGFASAMLMQQDANPRHFISVGTWNDPGSVAQWRSDPEFPERLGRVRAHCEDFVGLDYTLASRVP